MRARALTPVFDQDKLGTEQAVQKRVSRGVSLRATIGDEDTAQTMPCGEGRCDTTVVGLRTTGGDEARDSVQHGRRQHVLELPDLVATECEPCLSIHLRPEAAGIERAAEAGQRYERSREVRQRRPRLGTKSIQSFDA